MTGTPGMADPDLPSDVQRFLHDQIDSLEQLESLLLLFRSRDVTWSAAGVAKELLIADSVAEEALRALCQRGLLTIATTPEQFRYGPSSTELAVLVERLGELYTDQRAAIMRLMSANAIQRLRAGALGMFSNAAVAGKREKSGDGGAQ